MKKLHLKLWALALGILTVFTDAPVYGSSSVSNKSSKVYLSTTAKVIMGISGASALVLLGALIYHSSKNSSVKPPRPSGQQAQPSTGNLTNDKNLCFWHSSLQLMYGMTAFRNFIMDVKYYDKMKSDAEAFCKEANQLQEEAKRLSSGNSTNASNIHSRTMTLLKGLKKYLPESQFPDKYSTPLIAITQAKTSSENILTACKQIDQIRKIFSEMQKGNRVNRQTCVKIAQEVFKNLKDPYGDLVFGQQQDVSELWYNFISNVQDVYKKYCEVKYGTLQYDEESQKMNSFCNVFKAPWRMSSPYYGKGSLLLSDLVHVDAPNSLQKVAVVNEIVAHRPHDAELTELLNKLPPSGLTAATKTDKRLILGKGKGDLSSCFANALMPSLEEDYPPFIEEAKKIIKLDEIDVPIIENQFTVYAARFDDNRKKCTRRIDFGDGKVTYRGERYQVTGIMVHSGSSIEGGHYYAYRKDADDNWFEFNDCGGSVPRPVSWDAVKHDAETNCTAVTFTKIKE